MAQRREDSTGFESRLMWVEFVLVPLRVLRFSTPLNRNFKLIRNTEEESLRGCPRT